MLKLLAYSAIAVAEAAIGSKAIVMTQHLLAIQRDMVTLATPAALSDRANDAKWCKIDGRLKALASDAATITKSTELAQAVAAQSSAGAMGCDAAPPDAFR